MKKEFVLGALLLLSFLAMFLYFKYIYGWMEFRSNTDTPKEYLSHIVISTDKYATDKTNLLVQLKSLQLKHKEFFYNKAYFDSTQIFIDSIIYSPDYNKMALLIVVKNPTYRQLMPDKNHEWYYDATCYAAVRQRNSIELSFLGPAFTNDDSYNDAAENIREECFRRYATTDTTDNYDYNINDLRFWNAAIWRKIEEDKIKQKAFEEEKIKHPENVYEPKM